MPEGYLPAALYMQPMYGCWNYDIHCTLYSIVNSRMVLELIHCGVYMHTTGKYVHVCLLCMCMWMGICVSVYVYVHLCVYVHIYMYAYCVCVCACVCVCVCDDRDVASLLSKATQSALRSS